MTKLTAMIEWLKAAHLSGRYASAAKILGLTVVCLAVLATLWIPDLLTRADVQLTEAGDRLKAFQVSLDELERLKAKAVPAATNGATLKAVLETTLGEQLSGLNVTALESTQFKIAGRAEFDSFVRWLGEIQSGHRLGVKTLTIDKQADGADIELVLVGGE